MATPKAANIFKSDRKTFSSYERKFLSAWFSYIGGMWQRELHKSYGTTDEGEGWFVVSSDTPEGVSTLVSISIAVMDDGERNYRYFCGPRRHSFIGCSLIDVIKQQAPDGLYEAFPHDFDTQGETANVIQFIPKT